MKKLRLDRKVDENGKTKIHKRFLPKLSDGVTDESIRGLKGTLTFIQGDITLVKIEETEF
ncbi:MAG: hypothetical protein QP763_08630 [Peptoniphilus duerdenii]|uniref:hypothetical protein n=1 Tax=Peptoniphilus duerdenii TaxID=507750 RepID=UPI00255099AE|nr:hypothetical protein [Peptoniphilus duerdenii]MDK8277098.1 hypothetical protein [Peptoniphilus duerdenii]